MSETPRADDPTQPTGAPPTPGRAPQEAPSTREPAASRRDHDEDPLRGSRTSGLWVTMVVVGVLIVLLVVFTLQNTQPVDLAFLGWEGRTPLSAAILIAAAAGILITALAGSLRILQLRRRVKRQGR
ncbi:lipopolysaccharide assembly protein LapA domain-containing protein [Nocardioides perillae]|uniref:Putative integral membrane protein n=1 Tax=Nocardioides perillae TaxID=1119534 RepID=A0A7Y9UMV9_9ACTN|nr:lipopolysaccharide assembly protein LapA domain-containing protein [Nocardioides perillae]NYG56547.1 putative integral membrane protein [Nocardioides perillae]